MSNHVKPKTKQQSTNGCCEMLLICDLICRFCHRILPKPVIPMLIQRERYNTRPNRLTSQAARASRVALLPIGSLARFQQNIKELLVASHIWGYPKIIHFNGTFHQKPSILGYPHLWNPPYDHCVCWITFEIALWDHMGNPMPSTCHSNPFGHGFEYPLVDGVNLGTVYRPGASAQERMRYDVVAAGLMSK